MARNSDLKPQSVSDIIAEVAREKGVPVGLALAVAQWESGLDPNNIGDNGHSVGLFQLNDKGEGSGLSVAQRQDPRRNAEIALSEIANVYKREPNASWGQIATDAQRPASYTFPAYHAAINAAQAKYQNADDATVIAAYHSGAASAGTTPTSSTDATGGGSGVGAAGSASGLAAGTPNELAASFGYSSAFFNSDPSLKKLIDSYAGQDATNSQVQARFKADLMDTAWYKQHTAAQREWTQLQTSDPTEAAHQLLTMQQQLAQQAKSMGVQIPVGQLSQMARSALSMYGQNVPTSAVQDMIGAQLHYKGSATYSGDVGNDITTLKDLAHSYGVPISDQTMQGWLRNIVSNGVDPKSYSDYLQQQAQSLYPTLAPQIKQGLTFQQAVDPYRQIAAQKLEIDPNTVDFTQPKWMKALTQIDPKTGDRTAMSLDQWQNTVMTDPAYGYDKTNQAKSDAASLAVKIGQMWGAIG